MSSQPQSSNENVTPILDSGFATSTSERWKFCPNCGTKLEEGWKVCPECGQVIGGVAAPPVVVWPYWPLQVPYYLPYQTQPNVIPPWPNTATPMPPPPVIYC